MACALALVAYSGDAWAQSISAEPMSGMSGMGSNADISALPARGDLALGAQIAQHCATCHQTKPHNIVGVPPISGFPPEAFEREMTAFRTRAREHVVMNAIASTLSDTEIVALASYYSALPRLR